MESWEFGRTLRRWRDRVAPEAAGVPAGRRRRAAGLRREELAALAGISATVHTPQEQADHEARLVADLRLTASRYPADRTLSRLVAELADRSPRFAELWDSADPPPLPDPSKRKVIAHPAVGHITLDCDTLLVAVDDLRISVYTAEPGTQDADRLALAVVLGTQSLVE